MKIYLKIEILQFFAKKKGINYSVSPTLVKYIRSDGQDLIYSIDQCIIRGVLVLILAGARKTDAKTKQTQSKNTTIVLFLVNVKH